MTASGGEKEKEPERGRQKGRSARTAGKPSDQFVLGGDEELGLNQTQQ